MATVSRGLPKRPHLDVPKRQARELLKQCRIGQADALDRVRRRHPDFSKAGDAPLTPASFRLADAQLVIAREYGLATWTQLKERINANPLMTELDSAIRAGDCDTVVRLLRSHPKLLHLPVRSGNWGPPMSHAANLGRLEVIQAVAKVGARDFQHAFDRALLQGKIDCARWLHEHGARLEPGIVMGACETLNPVGLQFLADLNAPFTDRRGDRLAPLALVLETYGRNPAGKHAVLEIFAQHGYELPKTPMMAFHRGDLDELQKHLGRDRQLLNRRFTLREIYPPELGCVQDGRSGLHGTPIDGTTLLHLAIDFDELEIFQLLLDRGADVNARATIEASGFGAHTPLFHAVVSCAYASGPERDGSLAQALLDRGASPAIRASLHKFMDWIDEPGWHEARDVTPAEWARTFPEQSWVNAEALRLLVNR